MIDEEIYVLFIGKLCLITLEEVEARILSKLFVLKQFQLGKFTISWSVIK